MFSGPQFALFVGLVSGELVFAGVGISARFSNRSIGLSCGEIDLLVESVR